MSSHLIDVVIMACLVVAALTVVTWAVRPFGSRNE